MAKCIFAIFVVGLVFVATVKAQGWFQNLIKKLRKSPFLIWFTRKRDLRLFKYPVRK